MDCQLANSAVQLDSQGDLILIVHEAGKAAPLSSSFLVSSKILSLASRVFSAMLSPEYAEGRQLQETREKELGEIPTIELHEDDIAAMDFILSVIHFKTDRLNHLLTAEEIAKIAVQSDKYDLNNSLAPWISQWCDHRRFPVSAGNKLRDMGYGILAAYLFQSPLLERMSTEFVQNMPPDFAETWEKHHLMERLPEYIWNRLCQQIDQALDRLRVATLRTLNRLETKTEPGSVRCTRIGDQNGDFPESVARHLLYLNVLRQVGIWPSLLPFEVLPVSKARRLIKEAKMLASCRCNHLGHGDSSSSDLCPLQLELESLCQHGRRVQAEMKGVKSSLTV
ncbi:hypothetical protein NEMBOFW57_008039 [Staphylotrichum longicolle]|uniref:BTB domain-containing protein n=1 Tax=Staphylotrichum longicolle TaxID=669026 RepID=A0AAD4EQY7_9PEZI|nr:hypothetical protein NEMBOFW57_008039 [Staphylotrichum longicolle]